MKYSYFFAPPNYRLRRLLTLWVVSLVALGSMAAQSSYRFSGTITDAETQEPLIGAFVLLEGTGYGGVTDLDGNYEFRANVTEGDYKLVASYTGYASFSEDVSLGSNTDIAQSFNLGTDALNLEEIVVTGASVATSRRQLGNAISTLDNSALETSGAIAVDQALSGKVAGALVQQNSGDPAGGISVRLRGASTISGSSDPLYIIDGVIVNNSSAALVDLGGTSQNRLVRLRRL